MRTTITAGNFDEKLASIALHASNVADERSAEGREYKAAMLRFAATLSDKAKDRADLNAIAHLTGKYGVKSHVATQASVFSGRVFPKGSAANQGLKRARWYLSTTPENVDARVAAILAGNASADPLAALIAQSISVDKKIAALNARDLAKFKAQKAAKLAELRAKAR